MFHNQKLNDHINRIHERTLRTLYHDHNSTFDELLAKDCSFNIHDSILQKVLIEIIKGKMKFPLETMHEVLTL